MNNRAAETPGRHGLLTLTVILGFCATAVLIFVRVYYPFARRLGLEGALGNIVSREIYSRTVIASNYFSDGFIRRGLGGTIAKLLSADWQTSTLLFIAFSLAWLLLPLAVTARLLARRVPLIPFVYLVAVLALSPQTFRGWAVDPVRTDMFVGGCIAWSVVAMQAHRHWLAMSAVLLGFLAHETAVVFGAPMLLAMAWQQVQADELDRRTATIAAAAFAVGLGLIMACQHLFSVPPDVVAANMLREAPVDSPVHRLWRDIAIYMAVAGSDALRTAACYNFELNPQYSFDFVMSLAVLGLYAMILPLRRQPLAVLLTMIVPVVFMMLIANDTGRWLKLAVLNAWLISIYYQCRPQAGEVLRPPHMALGAVLLIGLLAMGHTPFNHVSRATDGLASRLGVFRPVDLGQWMERCDPGWRRYVYGTGASAADRR